MAAYATETITVSNTAIGCTAAKLALAESLHGRNVKQIYVTVENYNIRMYYDGSTPTDSAGHLVAAGSSFALDGEAAMKLLMIRVTSDATVTVTYEV